MNTQKSYEIKKYLKNIKLKAKWRTQKHVPLGCKQGHAPAHN